MNMAAQNAMNNLRALLSNDIEKEIDVLMEQRQKQKEK